MPVAVLLALLASWLAGWLLAKVPGLDPAHANEVAKALVDQMWSLIVMAFTAGWLLVRRPGDTPKPPKTEITIPPRRDP